MVALDDRLGILEAAGPLIRKIFPDHWAFLLGELALYSFVILVITGTWLTFFFHPDMSEAVYTGPYVPLHGVRVSQAYRSVVDISFNVRGGLFVRQTHHWAALAFLGSICLHMLRIFFTGAFRKPREINWLIGLSMLILSMAEGFAGYSLPDDMLSGTGLRTMQGIVLSIPVIGTYLSYFVFGGTFPGHSIIPRLFAAHILLLPGLLAALMTTHLLLVFTQKHTQWRKAGREQTNVVGEVMFPTYIAKTIGLFFLIAGTYFLAAGVVQINPIWVFGPYEPSQGSTGSQPDWYMGFLEGGLRLTPNWETVFLGHTVAWNVFLPGVVLPVTLFGALYVYPFVERWVVGDHGERNLLDRPRDQPTRTALGAAGVMFFALLTFAGGDDVTTFMFGLSIQQVVWTLRALVFVLPAVTFVLTRRLCHDLQRSDRRSMLHGRDTGDVVSGDNGYHVRIRRLDAGEIYTTLPADPGPDDHPAPAHPTFPRSMARWARRGVIGWERRHRLAPPSRQQYAAARSASDSQRKNHTATLPAPDEHPLEDADQ